MDNYRGNLQMREVTHGQLREISEQNYAVRAGSTIDPEQRAGQYEREGYSGTMYFAKTENMNKAESKLLQDYTYTHNVHQSSNSPSEPGYSYVIKGRRYN